MSIYKVFVKELIKDFSFKTKLENDVYLISGRKIPVIVDRNGSSFTDGNKIVVSMAPSETDESSSISEDFGPDKDIAKCFMHGLAIHEAEHVHSSNFVEFRKFIDRVSDYFKKMNPNTPNLMGDKIGKFIGNSIEDGRIERRSSVRYPGVAKYLLLINYNLLFQHKCSGDVVQDLLNNILCLSKTGTYLRDTVEMYKDNYEIKEILMKIKFLIKKGVECDNPIKVFDYAWQVFMICYPIFENQLNDIADINELLENFLNNSKEANEEFSENIDNRQNDQVGGQQQKSGAESNFDEEVDLEDDSSDGKIDDSQNSKNNSSSNSDSQSNSNFSKNNSNEDESSKSSLGAQSDSDEQNQKEKKDAIEEKIKDLKDALKGNLEKAIENEKKSPQPLKKDKSNLKEAEKLTQEELNEIRKENSYFGVKDVSKSRLSPAPLQIRIKGEKLKKIIKKIIANKKSERLYSQKRGRLDSKKYTSAISSFNKNIFYKKEIDDVDDAVFYIVIDNSGSMHGSKFQKAMEIASLIEEALRGIVNFKIIGYNVPQRNEGIYILRDFNDKKSLSISSIPDSAYQPNGGTCDAMALTYALRELLKQREKKKVCFIISDGEPNTKFNNGYRGIKEECKKVVKDFKHNGVHLISIGLEIASYQEEAFKDTYGRNVIFRNLDNIEHQLVKYIQQIFQD